MISWRTVEDKAGLERWRLVHYTTELVVQDCAPQNSAWQFFGKGSRVFPRKYSVKVSLSFIYDRKVRTVKVK